MAHAVLIWADAASAAVALAAIAGGRRRPWFAVHRSAMVAMLAFLVAALATDLGGRTTADHVRSAGLVALGVVMVAQTHRAAAVRGHDRRRFVERAGFGTVGLVDAFVVVLLLDAGVPAGLVVAVGIAVAVVGHLVLVEVRDRDRTQPDRPVAQRRDTPSAPPRAPSAAGPG